MAQRSYDRFCPLSLALDLIGDRWTLLIVYGLLQGPKRYSDLDTFANGAGSTLLTDRLRRLIEAGLASRQAEATPGSPTVYSLTPRGAALAPIVAALSAWGLELLLPRDASTFPHEGRVFDQTWTSPASADLPAEETYQWSIGDKTFHFLAQGTRLTQFLGPAKEPTVTVTCPEDTLQRHIRGEIDWPSAIESGELQISGPPDAIARMLRTTGLG
jgi:DNA-binding HxlR family transcriptional regulator